MGRWLIVVNRSLSFYRSRLILFPLFIKYWEVRQEYKKYLVLVSLTTFRKTRKDIWLLMLVRVDY